PGVRATLGELERQYMALAKRVIDTDRRLIRVAYRGVGVEIRCQLYIAGWVGRTGVSTAHIDCREPGHLADLAVDSRISEDFRSIRGYQRAIGRLRKITGARVGLDPIFLHNEEALAANRNVGIHTGGFEVSRSKVRGDGIDR